MVNRQLEIIYILMNKDTVTAEELAAHFEVSTRTVYRDIDSLSMAGFPVYASRGKGGGIRLMERFILDRRLLTGEEQQRILAAMASLRETGAFQDEKVLEKLQTFFKAESMEWVAIDFSDWSGRRRELFGRIKEAILGRHVMEFDYYGQRGQMMHRKVEPVQLLFKEYTWYVRAFCRGRGAMRLFKVLRMKRVEVREETFEPGPRHREDRPVEENRTVSADQGESSAEIVFRVDRREAYRVYDRFEEEEITVLPQGDFEIRMQCPVDDWVYGLILSFGPAAVVLEPDWVREELAARVRQMGELYGGC
ncbi:MAG: YafY family transcriptional regulator [Lachnospiraceae bacterium]|nr:YafY family transcriptional regulator [Lachnospiraceae bacterium]